jgi:hypothetical protein
MPQEYFIRNKIKDDKEVFRQSVIICELLEEAQLTYDEMGIAGPVVDEIRRFLNEHIAFYTRHRTPDSKCRGMALRHLRLANTIAVKTLVKTLNKLLIWSRETKVINMPTTVRTLELAFHKLFYYSEESGNDSEHASSTGNEGRKEDDSPLPMAL